MANPTAPDYQTYTGPQPMPDTVSPNYPLAMYHPTKGTAIVADATAQAALVASDSLWSPVDPNPTT